MKGVVIFANNINLENNLKKLDEIGLNLKNEIEFGVEKECEKEDEQKKWKIINYERIIKANGSMCQVVQDLMSNYIDSGRNLDGISYQIMEVHMYDCNKCRQYMLSFGLKNNEKEDVIVQDLSVLNLFLKEIKQVKNKCQFFKKNLNLIVSKVRGEEPLKLLKEHGDSCKRCQGMLSQKIMEVEKVNVEMGKLTFIDCINFAKYVEYYINYLLDQRISDMMQGHYLCCSDCNNVFVNKMPEYAKNFCIGNRSDKIKIE